MCRQILLLASSVISNYKVAGVSEKRSEFKTSTLVKFFILHKNCSSYKTCCPFCSNPLAALAFSSILFARRRHGIAVIGKVIDVRTMLAVSFMILPILWHYYSVST